MTRALLAGQFIGTGLVRMPVRVEERVHLLRIRGLQCELEHCGGAGLAAAIDQQCALRPPHGDDVATRR
jgi:hypothetical protein